jgi:dTMP kinase
MCEKSGLALDEHAVDLFIDLAGEVDVGAAAAAGLDGDAGDSGFGIVELDPDGAAVDDAAEDPGDAVVVGERAVAFEDLDDGGVDLVHGQFVAAGDGILDERDAGFDAAFLGGVATRAEAQKRREAEERQDTSQHAPNASTPPAGVKPEPDGSGLVIAGAVGRFTLRMTRTFAELGFAGRLIAVEGLDGSGKSTQIHLLKRWLELQGLKVFFSEWNSSELVKTATSKGKKRQLLTPTTFSLIHATDFADRYERQLVPLMRAGYLVLCDRYIFTAFARDTVRGCPAAWVRGLYGYAALPDLTFFFNAPLEVSLRRILEGRPELKYFEAGMDLRLSPDPYESFRIFQGRLIEQYLAMSTEFGFLVVDADQSVEAQQNVLRQLVSVRVDLDRFKLSGR